MSYNNKGGRGKKAPYTTEIVRVPSPIRGIIDGMIEKFREIALSGKDKDYEDSLELLPDLLPDKLVTGLDNTLDKDKAIVEAKKIYKAKKAKKQQFEKLLQVIYDDESITLDD